MKYLVLLYATTFYMLTFGCKTQRNVVFEKNDLCCKDAIVTPNMYLSSRIPDCDLAIKYMDSVICNEVLYFDTSRYLPNVVEGRFNIPCDSINLFRDNKHFFYINSECFIGQPCTDFYQVFCSKKNSEIFKIIESASFSREVGVRLYLFSNSDFDMIAEFKNGLTNKIEFKGKRFIENK
ncbi:MAG: hypothetical protein WAS72_03790 [Saprospiraceae bacterium]